MSKLLVLVALVGAAVATKSLMDERLNARVIPVFAEQLKGDQLVEYVNSVQGLWKAKVNPDRSHVNALMHIKHTKLPAGVEYNVEPTILADIPESFDSRTNWPNCRSIGLIRDQSQCGSCWSFGAAEAMSDRVCIGSNGAKTPLLAAEDILSCCGYSCGYGCEGGYPIRAWNYWVGSGVCTGGGYYEQEGCKPYSIEPCGTHVVNNVTHKHDCSREPEAETPDCASGCTNKNYKVDYNADKFYGKSAYAVRANVQSIQQEIMTNGPVEAAFTVYEDFMDYNSGVYAHTAGSVLGGHAVRILGWGVENGVAYWNVANSWNTNWGENGYFKIIRGKNDCGIEEAIVAGLAKV